MAFITYGQIHWVNLPFGILDLTAAWIVYKELKE